MKVFKINKKEFIIAVVMTVILSALVITSFFVSESLATYLRGILVGFSFPLIFGITTINRDKTPFEIIEIPEEEKIITVYGDINESESSYS